MSKRSYKFANYVSVSLALTIFLKIWEMKEKTILRILIDSLIYVENILERQGVQTGYLGEYADYPYILEILSKNF